MTAYVIDTNIVFSILHSPQSAMAAAFFKSEEYGLKFVAPQYLQHEIEDHRQKLLSLTRLDSKSLDRMLALVYRRIKFFEDRLIPLQSYWEAVRLLRDIDQEDVPFVALSIYQQISLFTGDRKLYRGLLSRSYFQVVDFADLKKIHSIE
jgi:predicted nucleic acid-binding protein